MSSSRSNAYSRGARESSMEIVACRFPVASTTRNAWETETVATMAGPLPSPIGMGEGTGARARLYGKISVVQSPDGKWISWPRAEPKSTLKRSSSVIPPAGSQSIFSIQESMPG